jgi:antitoxin PrlF
MTAITVRARVRGNRHQVTLPREIREALQIHEDDELEFSVSETGEVTLRGYRSIPIDQLWYHTPKWQQMEREAAEEYAKGDSVEVFESGEAFVAALAESAGIDLDEVLGRAD